MQILSNGFDNYFLWKFYWFYTFCFSKNLKNFKNIRSYNKWEVKWIFFLNWDNDFLNLTEWRIGRSGRGEYQVLVGNSGAINIICPFFSIFHLYKILSISIGGGNGEKAYSMWCWDQSSMKLLIVVAFWSWIEEWYFYTCGWIL